MVELIAQAIATMEGWYVPGSRARRNNNPGNLRSWGANPIVGGYAAFPSADAGWAALRRQVQLNIGRGLTLEEFFGGKEGVYGGYAPSADKNDPAYYARFVAGKTGLQLGQPIASQIGTAAPSSPNSPESGSGDLPVFMAVAAAALFGWMLFS